MPKHSPANEEASVEGGRSSTRRDLVENQIVAEATRLFAERGFSGTSLKDIADATGLTRPAIYHYVRNKDELLGKLVAELAQGPVVALREINETGEQDPVERLRRMAYIVAGQQAEEPARFQLLIRSEADLSEELAGPYLQSRRAVLAEFVRVINDGIRLGRMRAVDSRIAALSILGQCNWVAWWQQPGASAEATRHVAESIADLAVASVISHDGAGGADDQVRDSPSRALALLKRDLRYLEQALGRAAAGAED
jgi:AcrR family transcriptional regulator